MSAKSSRADTLKLLWEKSWLPISIKSNSLLTEAALAMSLLFAVYESNKSPN